MNAPAGHRSCAPEDCSGLIAIPPQGPVPVSGVFPAGAIFRLLETRLQVIRLSPYRADLPARHPIRLGIPAGFLACYFPIWSFDLRSAIRSRDSSSHLCPLNGRYNSAPHGAPTTTGTPSPAGLAPGRVIPRSQLPYVLARLRRPVRLLQCPDRASLLRPGGFPQVAPNLAAEAGAGSRRLSGGCNFSPSGDWASGSPAFAISRGPPGTPPHTPGHGYRFPGMLLSPSPHGSR